MVSFAANDISHHFKHPSMAYRFKLDEPFQRSLHRIAREQLDRALSELAEREVNPTGVHESRKALKRLRALLRLVKPAIGEKVFSKRNSALRRAAGVLSVRRDEAVLLETIEKLERHTGASEILVPLRDAIQDTHVHLARPLETETAEKARSLLLKEAKHFAHMRLKGKGFATVQPGLEASYRTGRRALKNAYEKSTSENFHELRKAVQWHWRQMSLLSRAWPEAFDARVSAARELSQVLGDDHDLAMLDNSARNTPTLSPAQLAALIQLIEARQSELRQAVEYRAARLFAEAPRAFSKRMAQYWQYGRNVKSLLKPEASKASIEVVPQEKPGLEQNAEQPPTRQGPKLASKTPGDAPSQRRA